MGTDKSIEELKKLFDKVKVSLDVLNAYCDKLKDLKVADIEISAIGKETESALPLEERTKLQMPSFL